jgi:tripartite-type tricarboxylate transporter receptor subunit TctC
MKAVVTCVSLALALVAPGGASIAAEETPAQPLRIIVPLSAGSAFDILARAMGNAFKERTQQPVIVENRPGGNMGIAANACKSAPPDGSTICLLTQNAITLNPLLNAKLSYNPYNDLDPIAVVALQQQVLAVVPSLGIASVADLVKYSKANPNRLNYASLGLGSDSHLIMEWLKGVTGADLTHIPFNGSPPILTAMRSGEVHVTLLTPGTLKPQIDAGDLKALATRGADKRNPSLPDVPTFAEAGLPPLRATSWAGLFAPRGTPPEIIARLNGNSPRSSTAQAFAPASWSRQGSNRRRSASPTSRRSWSRTAPAGSPWSKPPACNCNSVFLNLPKPDHIVFRRMRPRPYGR